jgi:outer membrane murein-binding lipoprotein Lpp
MQVITPRPILATASPRNIRPIALFWMLGVGTLMLGGCVSQQTYETARHEVKTRATELAQTQADIQSLEQQREETHLANQREERSLATLKGELKKIQLAYEQLHKSNQAKLAALEYSIVALRARHQAMWKEISETKRIEKRLEALTAQHEHTMATTPSGPEARVTTVDGSPQEPHLVAVITPQTPQIDSTPTASQAPPAATSADTTPAVPQPAPVVATPPSPSTPAKAAQAPAAPQAPRPATAAAPQDESWFSGVTGWFTSLFDWIWA